MTLHRFKVLAAVVEHHSITSAAKKLHMTQPAVSIQLKQLEEKYGLPVIEVLGKKVYATEAGKKIERAYLKIAEEINNLDMEISSLKGDLTGKLKISAVSTAKYFIPKILGDFNRKYPHVDIQLKVANREEVLERLEKNLDDLVILSQAPKDRPIVKKELLEDALVIIAEPDHPFAKKTNLKIKNLSSEKFIIREKGSGTRMVMEKLFKKYKLNPRIIMELGSNSAIIQAVMAGFGLSMVSKTSIEHELKLKKLIILDIENFPVKHPWYMVYSKGKVLSRVASNFIKIFEDHSHS